MVIKIFLIFSTLFFHEIYAVFEVAQAKEENFNISSNFKRSNFVFNLKNDLHLIKRPMPNDFFGLFVKSGSYIAIRQTFPSNLFLDYYFQKVHLQNISVSQMTGIRVGGSLGYRF